MAYRLGRKAEEDIAQIYVAGVRLFGVVQAESYFAKLISAFEVLADNPRLARERFEITPPVRIHPCGSHVIVYTVAENEDVLVVRVRHGREDWARDPAQTDE